MYILWARCGNKNGILHLFPENVGLPETFPKNSRNYKLESLQTRLNATHEYCLPVMLNSHLIRVMLRLGGLEIEQLLPPFVAAANKPQRQVELK